LRSGVADRQFVERVPEFASLMTEKGQFRAALLRQRGEHGAMAPRKFRERMARIVHYFERLKRASEPIDQRRRVGNRIRAQLRALVGRMQLARLAAAESAKLQAKTFQRRGQAGGSS